MTDSDSETRDLTRGRGVVRVRTARIEVTSGPDAGRTAQVDRPTFVVGSGEQADLQLTDGTVSREHLRLALLATGIHLRDEGSKNGTWMGPARIRDILVDTDTALELGTTGVILRIQATPIDLPVSEQASFGHAIGVSLAMRHLFAVLERAAATDVTVLLEGESGVGKEVLAHAVHGMSARADAPFVALDCGAIPANLMESELFGHERGAFTGALDARKGMFEQAHGGTLFLDEIGELPLDLQPKLLRVLEQREVRPLGSAGRPRPVDVRIIAATNRRLAEAAHKNEFRRDLFYRLAVARVTIPPLRDRPEDILPIATAFLRATLQNDSASLPPDLSSLLTAYSWPGNVRELRNVIERYALLGVRDTQGLFDGGVEVTTGAPGRDLFELPYHEARRRLFEQFERGYVPHVLERAGGVVTKAAELAEVGRPTFYRMLERLRIANDQGD